MCRAIFFSFLIGAVYLPAQETQLTGPVSGLVFDGESRSLRRIIGVPGSAYVGDAVASELDLAAAAPNGRTVLAVTKGALQVLRANGDGTLSASALADGMSAADRIVWNRTSSAAAVWNATSGRLQLWRGETGDIIELGPLTGRVLSLAVSDRGAEIVAGIEDEGIFVFSGGAEARMAARTGRPTALVVAGDDLFFADSERQEILRIAGFANGGSPEVFAGAGQGLEDPVGLAVARDRSLLLVTSRTSRTLAVFRVGTGELQTQAPLDFEPSGMIPLTESLLWLNPRAGPGAPLQIAESRLDPTVWFVPIARADQ